jgi:hypothetical protein
VLLPQSDIAVPGGGFFSHTRYYCNQTSPYAGPNGYNWWVGQMPYAIASGSSVAIAFDPNNPYWFDQSGSDYVPRYGVVGTTLVEDTGAHTLTFTRTVNGQLEITVFNDFTTSPTPGSFLSQTDAAGITSTATVTAFGTIQQLTRTFPNGSSTATEILIYLYNASGSATGLLESVMLVRDPGTGVYDIVNQVTYDYYGSSDANGSVNDLKSATQQIPDGSGGWLNVAVDYYRYWLGTESTGIAHGLKMHFGPEACRLMFNAGIDLATASDSTVLPYADHYFEYDPTSGPTYGTVTKEIAAVCPTCPGGGTTADLFSYTRNPSSPTPGYNVWAMKTVQTLPDSSQIIVYTNYAGLPMLSVTVDPTATNKWITFYLYNSDGQLIWTAQPSAVTGYDDSYDDLLHYDTGTSLYEYLNNSTGLIFTTDYYASTDIGTGAVQDYVQNQNVRQGQSGSDIRLRSFTYTQNIDDDGNAVYPVATDVSYPNAADATVTITTSYAYSFNTGTNVMASKTTTLPVISTGQNGSGSADTTTETYDTNGNLTQFEDERGTINTYAYAAGLFGAVSQQALDTAGVNLETDFTYDNQGRLLTTTGTAHTIVLSGTATSVQAVTWMVYNQSVQPTSGNWGPDSTWTGQGYLNVSTSDFTLVDPVSITNLDKDGRSTDQITSVRSSGSGALSPTDTFDQTDWQSWSSTQYDNQHRTISRRAYMATPTSSLGIVDTNYAEIDYGYDALERLNRVDTQVGTIVRTVWITPQWVASVWLGTDDTGATDGDPTGGGAAGNNMVLVTQNQWDGGSDDALHL